MIGRILNIRPLEWPRVTLAWSIRFFYRLGFVIGWTVIVGMFVAKYGIFSLPYLFLANAICIMLGGFLFSHIVERFYRERIMLALVFLSGLILFLAMFLYPLNQLGFFALLLLVEAILLVQYRILLEGMTEEMFSPLESERVFPFVESADTFGGILAGLLIISLTSTIETPVFLYLWIATIFLTIPLLIFKDSMKSISNEEKEDAEISVGRKFFEKLRDLRKMKVKFSFVKNLIALVLFQWILFNLLEFQYTRAIYQSVSNVVLEGGSGFEHTFVHDLGLLSILFGTSSLIYQLIVGGRVIHNLGIAGSMILHALVSLFSVVGMLLGFGMPTAVFARNNFTVTSIIFTNAYHSSYYAVDEKFRSFLREIFEGFVRPLGALLGASSLILLEYVFAKSSTVLAVNVLLVVAAVSMLVFSYIQQYRYTDAALSDLAPDKSMKERSEAIEILTQRGHKGSLPHLHKLLLAYSTPFELREKIIEALKILDDESSLTPLLRLLREETRFRDRILDALNFMREWRESRENQMYKKHELLNVLRNIYENEKEERVQLKVINLIAKISSMTALEFLLKILKTKKNSLKAAIISSLGVFRDEDIVPFIKPYLNAKNAQLEAAAAVALGRLKDFKDRSEYAISSMLYSGKAEKLISGIYAAGEMKLKNKRAILLKYSTSKNFELSLAALIALAKMGSARSIMPLVNIIQKKDSDSVRLVMDKLDDIDVRIRRKIDKMLKRSIK